MDERIAVQHLHRAGKLRRLRGLAAQQFAGGHAQHRPHPLAAGKEAVTGGLIHLAAQGQIRVTADCQPVVEGLEIRVVLLLVIHPSLASWGFESCAMRSSMVCIFS